MLLLVVAVCIPFAIQRLIPSGLMEFSNNALSAIGFVSNFYFYFSTTEYGAGPALLKPLLHTWSLGVEEQFYIVAPILIIFIWKFARFSLLTLFCLTLKVIFKLKFYFSLWLKIKFFEQIAKATAIQMNILFHWPNKSALVAMGQNMPNGMIHAVATNTLFLFLRLALKQVQIIDQRNTTPKINPINPVSCSIWM